MDAQTLIDAQNEGYAAYTEGRPVQPTLSPLIREMVKDMEVGDGAAEIFKAFTRGFHLAADDECARLFSEV